MFNGGSYEKISWKMCWMLSGNGLMIRGEVFQAWIYSFFPILLIEIFNLFNRKNWNRKIAIEIFATLFVQSPTFEYKQNVNLCSHTSIFSAFGSLCMQNVLKIRYFLLTTSAKLFLKNAFWEEEKRMEISTIHSFSLLLFKTFLCNCIETYWKIWDFLLH